MTTSFTPLLSMLGGVLIGLAATLLMAVHGRIAGVSGIFASLLVRPWPEDWSWRIAFLIGMGVAPLVYFGASGSWPPMHFPATGPGLAVGGFLVGFGVALGAGCTSGHGVCGLARRSTRSLVATLVFMTTAIATVFALRHAGV